MSAALLLCACAPTQVLTEPAPPPPPPPLTADQQFEALAQRYPSQYLATQSKAKRKGKIFIDFLRNGRGATFIAPYSTRARDGAPVAVPLEWDELDSYSPAEPFTVRNIAERLRGQKTDPFAPMATIRQRLRPPAVSG
jgi:bifunctional non-homologous end joining protein LigD